MINVCSLLHLNLIFCVNDFVANVIGYIQLLIQTLLTNQPIYTCMRRVYNWLKSVSIGCMLDGGHFAPIHFCFVNLLLATEYRVQSTEFVGKFWSWQRQKTVVNVWMKYTIDAKFLLKYTPNHCSFFFYILTIVSLCTYNINFHCDPLIQKHSFDVHVDTFSIFSLTFTIIVRLHCPTSSILLFILNSKCCVVCMYYTSYTKCFSFHLMVLIIQFSYILTFLIFDSSPTELYLPIDSWMIFACFCTRKFPFDLRLDVCSNCLLFAISRVDSNVLARIELFVGKTWLVIDYRVYGISVPSWHESTFCVY